METFLEPALIFRVQPYGESDMIVSFVTPGRGRQRGLAKGARRSRRRFVNCLDIFCLVRLEYGLKKAGGLCFLHSGRLLEGFPGLRSSFRELSYASFMVELTEELFPVGVAEPGIFDLFCGVLERLSAKDRVEAALLVFEGKAMALGGFAVNLGSCFVCGRAYRYEGRAVFDPGEGAIACTACRQETALTPGLSPEGVSLLKRIQEEPWNSIKDLDPDEAASAELRTVNRLHRETRVGGIIRSAKYLSG
ncbi:MAG: DNA repair protein RecO [Desulfobacteraceae bacterium]